jgi:hypothetical protein
MRSRLGAYRITPVGIVVFSVLIVGLVVLFFGPRSTEGAAFTIVVLSVTVIFLATVNYRGSRARYEALSERQIDFGAHTRDPREESARANEPLPIDEDAHRGGGREP